MAVLEEQQQRQIIYHADQQPDPPVA